MRKVSTSGQCWLFLISICVPCVRIASSSNDGSPSWSIDLPATDFGSMDFLSSSNASPSEPRDVEVQFSPGSSLPAKSRPGERQRPKRPRGGRASVELQGTSFTLMRSTQRPASADASSSLIHERRIDYLPQASPRYDVSISFHPSSTLRLGRLVVQASVAFAAAFSGTLRLLAPMVLARRALNAGGDLVYDYLRGRYLRTTYTRVENMYIRYYELPAFLRALSRCSSHVAILLLLSKVMGWMVGMQQTPCRLADGQCHSRCILLWIVAVVGTGHACSTWVAVWGGPLRLQVAASHLHTGRNLAARVFTKPWYILQWMQDPEQWISMVATPQNPVTQPFEPKAILFPATWVPLRLIQALAVAKAASSLPVHWESKRDPVRTIMRRFLVFLALADEWHRVFIIEKRVGLAIGVALCYLVACITLTIAAGLINPIAGLMMLPTLLAICVSGWMNVVIFWNRLATKQKRETINAFNMRRQAALKAIKGDVTSSPLPPPSMSF